MKPTRLVADPAGLARAVSDPGRLASLDATGLLDSGREEAFDRLTRLTSRLLGVPVALVSLVDSDRQYFKSQVGLPDPWERRGETPLSHSFCQYVVRDEGELVIEDARVDPVLELNGAIKDIGVVAYAGVPLRGQDGQVLGSLCAIDSRPRKWSETDLETLRDLAASVISEIELRRAIAHDAFHHPLTGLPNRALLLDRAARALADPDPGEHPHVAVAVADLAHFAVLNQADGREAGDAVLIAAARRLEEAAGPSRTVAHLGGDNFAVLARLADASEAATLGSLLVSALDPPFLTDGGERHVGAYVGVAVAGIGLQRGPALLEAAEDATTRAKARGRGSVELYGRALRAEAAHRLSLESELRRALEREQLSLVYQPIVELDSGRVRGVEALLRWQHPELGAVPPADFIPVAEECGLIGTIGAWVLREATAAVAVYNRRHPGREIDVAVNLSPVQIGQPSITETVSSALADAGLDARRLVLEITEGVLVEQEASSAARLPELSALGARLALDDFGTGFSSLSYLERFPIDIIKIDRCFVAGVERDGQEAAIVRAVMALAEGLELQVIAEGVETSSQAHFLRLLGCGGGQGWLFARPAPALQLEATIAEAQAIEPTREADRLASLRSYGILDTPPEQAFDDLARLAAEICGTDSGFINLIDEARQWTKAAHGAAPAHLPRSDSFCAMAINTPTRTMVVEDASLEPSLEANPLVVEGMRFYAGAPLVNEEGYALGTLCVADGAPHQLSDPQRDALQSLARLAVDQLEIRRQARALRDETEARRRAEKRLGAILEQAPDAFVAMNSHGEVTEWNARACELFGYTREEALGRTVAELIVPEQARAAHRRGLQRYLSTGQARIIGRPVELDAVDKDGELVPVELTLSAVSEGGQQVITGFLRDIAERRAAEREAEGGLTDLRTMSEVTRRLSTARDTAEIGRHVVEAAQRLGGAGAVGCLLLPDPAARHLEVVVSSEARLVGAKLELRAGASVAVQAFLADESRFITDGALDPAWARALARDAGVSAAAFEPLRLHGQAPLGILVIGWPEAQESMPERLRPLLSLLAGDTAIALDRATLVSRLAHAADTDPLTGLWNRGVWARDVPREMARSRREGQPLCVALLDLDRFKAYNDAHGHQAGDRLLVDAATAWRQRIRASDLLARYGGEEFALLLPACELASAEEMLGRLARATPGGQTCSVGVAEWDGAESADALIRRADEALYGAKAAGRDRVVAAGA